MTRDVVGTALDTMTLAAAMYFSSSRGDIVSTSPILSNP